MEEDLEDVSYFSEKIKNELRLYKKYLEYSKDKKIKIGNKNWLIIDSSKNKYLKIVEVLEKYNADGSYYIRKFMDNDFLEKKGINEKKLLNAFEIDDKYIKNINVLVVSDIAEDLAVSKYGAKCTFFANLDAENAIVSKKEMIQYFFKDNHFRARNKRNLEYLLNFSEEEIENTLTKAFTMALNDKTNLISNKYLSHQKSGLKSNLKGDRIRASKVDLTRDY